MHFQWNSRGCDLIWKQNNKDPRRGFINLFWLFSIVCWMREQRVWHVSSELKWDFSQRLFKKCLITKSLTSQVNNSQTCFQRDLTSIFTNLTFLVSLRLPFSFKVVKTFPEVIRTFHIKAYHALHRKQNLSSQHHQLSNRRHWTWLEEVKFTTFFSLLSFSLNILLAKLSFPFFFSAKVRGMNNTKLISEEILQHKLKGSSEIFKDAQKSSLDGIEVLSFFMRGFKLGRAI